MSYYFSNDYTKSNKQKISYNFRNQNFVITTDDNVFSKSKIDFGSEFMVDTILNNTELFGQVLDIGCGYGTISLLLAKFSNANFIACDVNERAVNLCNENARLNNLNGKIHAVVSDACDNINENDFDFIVSNPPIRAGNTTLYKFFNSSIEKLKNGGASFWVFRKQQGAETYTKKLKEIYGNAEVLDKKKSYWIVKCVKEGNEE